MISIYSDNGTLTQLDLEDYYQGTETLTITTAEDAIYLGSTFPFNKFFTKMVTANTEAASIDVKYYSTSGWLSTVNIIDSTAGFTKDGYIEFVPSKTSAWIRKDTEDIDELENVTIYDMYWLKIELDATTSETVFSFIGNIFSSDYDIYSEYPEMEDNRFLTAFKSGKTDWEEQRYVATELLIKDLKARGVIQDANQILDKDDLRLVCVPKVAQIAFRGFGQDYEQNRKDAEAEYQIRLNKSFPKVDKNANGLLDHGEAGITVGMMHR